MGKLHARGNGITEDIDFNWLYQLYGMEYKNWSILAQRWLKLQPKALSSRRMIYAELSGDFPLGDSRQPIYKSLRPFDLVS
ncbi:Uncharacterised protein [Acinetobacter baumannii]|nr:Uncharacterised protein [Acinetobacter baumannii]